MYALNIATILLFCPCSRNSGKDERLSIRHIRHIGDFNKWKDHDSYQKAFDRLLRDLKAEAS